MADAPYNIVLILTDQHRADHLSCYGNPVLSTPHLDSLAVRGLRCRRCYVANPSCMPNRATLLTGCLPSLHGVRYNGIPLHAQTETFVQTLRQAGYHTALIGKSDAHLRRPPTEQDQGEVEHSQPYYGFDEVYVSTGYGDTVWGHYWQWLTARHPQPHTLRGAANALPLDRPVPLPQAWRTRVPEELYPTTYITEQRRNTLNAIPPWRAPPHFFSTAPFLTPITPLPLLEAILIATCPRTSPCLRPGGIPITTPHPICRLSSRRAECWRQPVTPLGRLPSLQRRHVRPSP